MSGAVTVERLAPRGDMTSIPVPLRDYFKSQGKIAGLRAKDPNTLSMDHVYGWFPVRAADLPEELRASLHSAGLVVTREGYLQRGDCIVSARTDEAAAEEQQQIERLWDAQVSSQDPDALLAAMMDQAREGGMNHPEALLRLKHLIPDLRDHILGGPEAASIAAQEIEREIGRGRRRGRPPKK